MSETHESTDFPPYFGDEPSLEWMEQHRDELKQQVSGQSLLYGSLILSAVLGLAAHIGGYILLESATSGLLGLLADLLHALGWSLWTGAVVALLIQVVPEVKRRQIEAAIDAYDAWRRKHVKSGSDRSAAVTARPRAGSARRKQTGKRDRSSRK